MNEERPRYPFGTVYAIGSLLLFGGTWGAYGFDYGLIALGLAYMVGAVVFRVRVEDEA